MKCATLLHVCEILVLNRLCVCVCVCVCVELLTRRHAGKRLKVVLMSATLAVDALRDYFGKDGVTVGAVAIQGRTFPVTRFFLSDAIEQSGYTCTCMSHACRRSAGVAICVHICISVCSIFQPNAKWPSL